MQLTPEFWQYAIPAFMTSMAAIITVWVSARVTNRRVDTAIDLSRPTGNGFAAEVRTKLTEIQTEQNRQAVHLARLDGVLSVLQAPISRVPAQAPAPATPQAAPVDAPAPPGP